MYILVLAGRFFFLNIFLYISSNWILVSRLVLETIYTSVLLSRCRILIHTLDKIKNSPFLNLKPEQPVMFENGCVNKQFWWGLDNKLEVFLELPGFRVNSNFPRSENTTPCEVGSSLVFQQLTDINTSLLPLPLPPFEELQYTAGTQDPYYTSFKSFQV